MKKLYSFASGKKGRATLIISAVITAVICLVMNLVLIPGIEASTNGIRCFDMNFGYSVETARQFLSLLSADGKSTYLNMQLPLDFVYPAAYCLFFSLMIIRLCKKVSVLCIVPLLLTVFDYLENISVLIILKSAEPSQTLIQCASIFTCVKTVLMYLAFLIIIVLLIRYISAKRKNSVNG